MAKVKKLKNWDLKLYHLWRKRVDEYSEKHNLNFTLIALQQKDYLVCFVNIDRAYMEK